jgi:hypothetical protein
MTSPNVHTRETPHTPSVGSKADFWKTVAGPLLGVVIGGVITAIIAYFSAQWTADSQRKLFFYKQTQSFSEFLALQYLPRSGEVPPECQTRLEECRRARQSAVQMYLFLPTAAQKELIKSYGPQAVKMSSAGSENNLSQEAKAFDNALKEIRQWLTGESDTDFTFILPCADWKSEEKLCRNP